jgi:hypothetical protein
MALITISFNGTQADLDDFCLEHRYQATIDGVSNPESKVQFFQRVIKEYVWGSVKTQRANRVGNEARQAELNKDVNF